MKLNLYGAYEERPIAIHFEISPLPVTRDLVASVANITRIGERDYRFNVRRICTHTIV